MTQDEVTWVLETIRNNWPSLGDSGIYGEALYGDGGYYDEDGYPNDLYRINRDEPLILETDERKRRGELTRANYLGASLATRSPSPLGTEYDHEVSTVISVRLEGGHVSQHGCIEDIQHFERLTRYAQYALATERVCPTIDAEDDIGRVDYHNLFIENEADVSNENRNHFRRDWDVRLVGDEQLP